MFDNSYWKIPEHIYEALKRYVDNRLPPGDFLWAVLSNNLVLAVMAADEQNRAKLCDIVGFIYNEIPFISHGNPEKVKKWLQGMDDNNKRKDRKT